MAGQLGLDPPTMELIKPTPHSHTTPSERTTGRPTPGGAPSGISAREPAGIPGAHLVAAAEARRALASCQAVSEALGASCGAHSLGVQVICSPGVGPRERQGVLAEVNAFFGSQGKTLGVPPDTDPRQAGACGEGGGGRGEGGVGSIRGSGEEGKDMRRRKRGRVRGG